MVENCELLAHYCSNFLPVSSLVLLCRLGESGMKSVTDSDEFSFHLLCPSSFACLHKRANLAKPIFP